MQNKQISFVQVNLSTALRQLPEKGRFALGALTCALISYYTPLLIIAITGRWVNSLTDVLGLSLGTTVLCLQTVIGNKIKRVMLLGALLAVSFAVVIVYMILSSSRSWSLINYWPDIFLPVTACLLNSILFLRYKRAANLP